MNRYQCSFNTFERAGLSADDASQLMRRAVQVAQEARQTYIAESKIGINKGGAATIKIALSLGPFGASLTPAQEFDGYYPPPYGPKAYSIEGPNVNSWSDLEQENKSIEALAKFHFDRLRVFAEDADSWSSIDVIAFETVPLIREIKAIRIAMQWLYQKQVSQKCWWISAVYPEGNFPERKLEDALTTTDVVRAFLTGDNLASPDGVGINCTTVECLPALVAEMRQVVGNLKTQGKIRTQPWLVLYPNGGGSYDIVNHTWKERKGSKKAWTDTLVGIVKQEEGHSQIWDGIVVGGCCETGPQDIRNLRRELEGLL